MSSTRRRITRRSIAAVLVAAALPPSVASAVPAFDNPGLGDQTAPAAVLALQGRSDAAARTADEPATPITVVRSVTDDGTDLFPVLPGAILLVVAAGGAGFTLSRMSGHKPGLSH